MLFRLICDLSAQRAWNTCFLRSVISLLLDKVELRCASR
jgi:hypothetical protein